MVLCGGGKAMDWDHLRFVMAVAEAGGLSAAGRRLRVDPATVSRRLDALEAELGCKLFHRSRRGLEPTAAGAKLAEHARRMEAEVLALSLELTAEDRGLQGTVVVAATEPIATGLVVPALPAFQAQHPGIAVELVTGIRSLDLGRREADLALRLHRPEQAELKLRRIGRVGYGLYASPAYLERQAPPQEAARFAGQRLIDWPLGYTEIPQVPWLRARASEAMVVLRSSSAVTRLAAAVAGVGIALLPCLQADPEPGLRRLPSEPPPALDLWLTSHRDLAGVPRVRALLDHLAAAARAAAVRLAGA